MLSLSLKRQSVLIQTKQWYISSLASRKSIRELEGEKQETEEEKKEDLADDLQISEVSQFGADGP